MYWVFLILIRTYLLLSVSPTEDPSTLSSPSSHESHTNSYPRTVTPNTPPPLIAALLPLMTGIVTMIWIRELSIVQVAGMEASWLISLLIFGIFWSLVKLLFLVWICVGVSLLLLLALIFLLFSVLLIAFVEPSELLIFVLFALFGPFFFVFDFWNYFIIHPSENFLNLYCAISLFLMLWSPLKWSFLGAYLFL